MSVLDVLQERGFIKQMSHEAEIKELLEKEKISREEFEGLFVQFAWLDLCKTTKKSL